MVTMTVTNAAVAGGETRFRDEVRATRFFKGNLHTHTTRSDGDAPPARVAEWYRKHGYDFLSITDHDMLTAKRALAKPGFVLLNGVELTGRTNAPGGAKLPVHVNAICGKSGLKGVVRKNLAPSTILAAQIRRAREDGALALVNHPNFFWALGERDLLAADAFELLEIASAHPLVHDKGDAAHPSAEALWDAYLTGKNRPVFATAVDDSHHYHEFGARQCNPGKAWVEVWAPRLSEQALCAALRAGHFYASRGARLASLAVTAEALELKVRDWNPETDHVEFIGSGGRVLARSTAETSRYELRGEADETYVRARVTQSGGREAWTQAYFTSPKSTTSSENSEHDEDGDQNSD